MPDATRARRVAMTAPPRQSATRFLRVRGLTGHKTESVYRRYAITSEADLREGVDNPEEPQ